MKRTKTHKMTNWNAQYMGRMRKMVREWDNEVMSDIFLLSFPRFLTTLFSSLSNLTLSDEQQSLVRFLLSDFLTTVNDMQELSLGKIDKDEEGDVWNEILNNQMHYLFENIKCVVNIDCHKTWDFENGEVEEMCAYIRKTFRDENVHEYGEPENNCGESLLSSTCIFFLLTGVCTTLFTVFCLIEGASGVSITYSNEI